MKRDEAAIRRCRTGQSDAFRLLVQRYQSEALAHALAILRNREDALDAVQDAFVDAYRALDRFDTRRPFYPWFYVLLRNRCYKLLAERRKHPATTDLAQHDCAILEGGADTTPIEHALAALSAQDREIITLKHLDGLTYRELAERLGIPVGTVMSRLYYARKRLRERLDRSARTDECG